MTTQLTSTQAESGSQNRKTDAARIMIVEDHPLMREGIAKWINSDPQLEVCGEFGLAKEAVSALGRLQPDLVLCDIALSDANGLELLKDIKAYAPDLPVVMLSMYDESAYALRVMRAGAHGYVMKESGGADVVLAIKQVLAGGVAFSSEVTNQVVHEMAGQSKGHKAPIAALTDREFEILQLYGSGKTTGQIADVLHISPKTVGVHRLNFCQKLGLKSTVEIIRYAVQNLDNTSG